MGSYLPSEISRLVLDYLKEVNCSNSWNAFLNESNDLHEYKRLFDEGKADGYRIKVDGKSLIEILNEYSVLKSNSDRNSNQQASGSTNNQFPDVFKTPGKANHNEYKKFTQNQRNQSHSTIRNVQYEQSSLHSPSLSQHCSPSQRHVSRIRSYSHTSLNFGNSSQRNENAPRNNTRTYRFSPSNRHSFPKSKTDHSDPVRTPERNRTEQTDSTASNSHNTASDKLNHRSNLKNLNLEDNIEVISLNSSPPRSSPLQLNEESALQPRMGYLNESLGNNNSDHQLTLMNKSIVVRSSEREENITVTTLESSVTPHESEPHVYHRAPATNSPRLILSYERSLTPSFTTPMKSKIFGSEDSPRRKGYLPRKLHLLSESPIADRSLVAEANSNLLQEDFEAFVEEFLTTQPFAQKVADNINKVLSHEDQFKNPSTSARDCTDDIVKDVIAKTEADPLFDQCLSFLFSTKDYDELGNFRNNPTSIEENSTIFANTTFSDSTQTVKKRAQETDSSVRTHVSQAEKEIDLIDVDSSPKPDCVSVASTPARSNNCAEVSVNDITGVLTAKTSSVHDLNSGTPNQTNLVYHDSSTRISSETDVPNTVISNSPTASQTSNIIESGQALDPPKTKDSDNGSLIKEVSIGTPFITNPVTQFQSLPNVQTMTAPLMSSSSSTSLLPASQIVTFQQPMSVPSPLPMSFSNMPTTFYIPSVENSNVQYQLIFNPAPSLQLQPQPKDVVPILPAPAKTCHVNLSIPHVNPSPLKIPFDYSPAKAFCADLASRNENVGNFITIPQTTEKQQLKNATVKGFNSFSKPSESNFVVQCEQRKTKSQQNTKRKYPFLFPSPPPKNNKEKFSANAKSKKMSKKVAKKSQKEPDIERIPVLSVPEPTPGKSDSLSAMELLDQISGYTSLQSPVLKSLISSAKIIADSGSNQNNTHVRTLDFSPQGLSQISPQLSPSPQITLHESRRTSPRVKARKSCKSPCSPLNCSTKTASTPSKKISNKKEFLKNDTTKLSPECVEISVTPPTVSSMPSMTETVLGVMECALQPKVFIERINDSCNSKSGKKDDSSVTVGKNMFGKSVSSKSLNKNSPNTSSIIDQKNTLAATKNSSKEKVVKKKKKTRKFKSRKSGRSSHNCTEAVTSKSMSLTSPKCKTIDAQTKHILSPKVIPNELFFPMSLSDSSDSENLPLSSIIASKKQKEAVEKQECIAQSHSSPKVKLEAPLQNSFLSELSSDSDCVEIIEIAPSKNERKGRKTKTTALSRIRCSANDLKESHSKNVVSINTAKETNVNIISHQKKKLISNLSEESSMETCQIDIGNTEISVPKKLQKYFLSDELNLNSSEAQIGFQEPGITNNENSLQDGLDTNENVSSVKETLTNLSVSHSEDCVKKVISKKKKAKRKRSSRKSAAFNSHQSAEISVDVQVENTASIQPEQTCNKIKSPKSVIPKPSDKTCKSNSNDQQSLLEKVTHKKLSNHNVKCRATSEAVDIELLSEKSKSAPNTIFVQENLSDPLNSDKRKHVSDKNISEEVNETSEIVEIRSNFISTNTCKNNFKDCDDSLQTEDRSTCVSDKNITEAVNKNSETIEMISEFVSSSNNYEENFKECDNLTHSNDSSKVVSDKSITEEITSPQNSESLENITDKNINAEIILNKPQSSASLKGKSKFVLDTNENIFNYYQTLKLPGMKSKIVSSKNITEVILPNDSVSSSSNSISHKNTLKKVVLKKWKNSDLSPSFDSSKNKDSQESTEYLKSSNMLSFKQSERDVPSITQETPEVLINDSDQSELSSQTQNANVLNLSCKPVNKQNMFQVSKNIIKSLPTNTYFNIVNALNLSSKQSSIFLSDVSLSDSSTSTKSSSASGFQILKNLIATVPNCKSEIAKSQIPCNENEKHVSFEQSRTAHSISLSDASIKPVTEVSYTSGKVMPPPKKRIRPVTLPSPRDGGMSPFTSFSPFISAQHTEFIPTSSEKIPSLQSFEKVSVPTVQNLTTKSTMVLGKESPQKQTFVPNPVSAKISHKFLSGKPRAMAEFYNQAVPSNRREFPISPGTMSSSSCTIDTFLAKYGIQKENFEDEEPLNLVTPEKRNNLEILPLKRKQCDGNLNQSSSSEEGQIKSPSSAFKLSKSINSENSSPVKKKPKLVNDVPQISKGHCLKTIEKIQEQAVNLNTIDSPVRCCSPLKNTEKPKSILSKRVEEKIPVGVKIPSKWNNSNISHYSKSIENEQDRGENTARIIRTRKSRPTLKVNFMTPEKKKCENRRRTKSKSPSRLPQKSKDKLKSFHKRYDRSLSGSNKNEYLKKSHSVKELYQRPNKNAVTSSRHSYTEYQKYPKKRSHTKKGHLLENLSKSNYSKDLKSKNPVTNSSLTKHTSSKEPPNSTKSSSITKSEVSFMIKHSKCKDQSPDTEKSHISKELKTISTAKQLKTSPSSSLKTLKSPLSNKLQEYSDTEALNAMSKKTDNMQQDKNTGFNLVKQLDLSKDVNTNEGECKESMPNDEETIERSKEDQNELDKAIASIPDDVFPSSQENSILRHNKADFGGVEEKNSNSFNCEDSKEKIEVQNPEDLQILWKKINEIGVENVLDMIKTKH